MKPTKSEEKEPVEIRRAGIVTFSEAPGMAVSLKVKYDF